MEGHGAVDDEESAEPVVPYGVRRDDRDETSREGDGGVIWEEA